MDAGFWAQHGVLFIVFMACFPRLTMFFGTSVASTFGGPLFWVGWLFAPRLTVAVIATSLYWTTDTVLCVATWMWALSGESAEKSVAQRAPRQLRARRHEPV